MPLAMNIALEAAVLLFLIAAPMVLNGLLRSVPLLLSLPLHRETYSLSSVVTSLGEGWLGFGILETSYPGLDPSLEPKSTCFPDDAVESSAVLAHPLIVPFSASILTFGVAALEINSRVPPIMANIPTKTIILDLGLASNPDTVVFT